jgi:hypothetical protein
MATESDLLVVSAEELAASKDEWLKWAAEVVLKHMDVVKRALVNAMNKARSCVLRYEYIHNEIYAAIKDQDEALRVDNATHMIPDRLRIDDIVAYKIYDDPDDYTNDVFVVLFRELCKERVAMLEEIATLFAVEFYHKFNKKEGRFYDAMPIDSRGRDEVYTTLHNLVCMWTYC